MGPVRSQKSTDKGWSNMEPHKKHQTKHLFYIWNVYWNVTRLKWTQNPSVSRSRPSRIWLISTIFPSGSITVVLLTVIIPSPLSGLDRRWQPLRVRTRQTSLFTVRSESYDMTHIIWLGVIQYLKIINFMSNIKIVVRNDLCPQFHSDMTEPR